MLTPAMTDVRSRVFACSPLPNGQLPEYNRRFTAQR
jgi:hypothetical protein